MEEYIAHGICMNKACGYSGDMTWFNEGEDNDTAVCPECGERTPWDEMADNEAQRDALWGVGNSYDPQAAIDRLDALLKRLEGME